MAYCPYHRAKHEGRVRKGVCIVSAMKQKDYFETFEEVMDYYNKEDIRKLGKKWSHNALENILNNMNEKQKRMILKKVER